MRGMFKSSKSKAAKKKKAAPRPYRPPSRRDILRQAYRQAGIEELLPKVRNRPTDLQRLLRAGGLSERLADNLTFKEQQELEADLSAIGIKAGRTSGTLPERLVAKWLLGKGLPYEGMGNIQRINRGWGFQIPLLGGRGASGGGTVVDILVGPRASNTKMGIAIFPEGAKWHLPSAQAYRDETKYNRLRLLGYQVETLWDWEVLSPGRLDAKMTQIIGGYKF